MGIGRHYERSCIETPNALQRWFMNLMTRKAQACGQSSHKIWSMKYVLDTYLNGQTGLTVLDCGAWNGWFLSYDVPAVAQRIALDNDAYYAREMAEDGIAFIHADMEKGYFPVAPNTVDLLVMTSTLEHLGCPEHVGEEVARLLKPGGVLFVTVPDPVKYGAHFWDDVTHKRPFTKGALRHLFEACGLTTLELCSYNHNLFIAGNLFPASIHRHIMRFRGKAIMYVARKSLS